MVFKIFSSFHCSAQKKTWTWSRNPQISWLLRSQSTIKPLSEAFVRRCSVKNMFLEISQKSQENTCARDSFFNKVAGQRPVACNFIKKESLAQVFSCEFCEIFKSTFSYRTPLVAASTLLYFAQEINLQIIFHVRN